MGPWSTPTRTPIRSRSVPPEASFQAASATESDPELSIATRHGSSAVPVPVGPPARPASAAISPSITPQSLGPAAAITARCTREISASGDAAKRVGSARFDAGQVAWLGGCTRPASAAR